MAEGTTADVVRTRRVEVIDEQGRVRAVVGRIGRAEGDVFGVTAIDTRGRQRVWVVAEDSWAEVGLDHGGDTAAALGVNDEGVPELYLGG